MAPSESIFSSLAGIVPVACTVLTYGYRDTDGLKTERSTWFAGTLSPRQIGDFLDAASASGATSLLFPEAKSTLFVPEQVGLRGLQWEIEREEGVAAPVQHAHHSLMTLECFSRPPVGVRQDRQGRDIETFLVEFLSTAAWDVSQSEIFKEQVANVSPFNLVNDDDKLAPAVVSVPVDNRSEDLFDTIVEDEDQAVSA